MLLLLACTASEELSVRVDFDEPPTVGGSELSLELAWADSSPVVGAEVDVEPWMPAHGHGASEEPAVEEQGGGLWVAAVSFPMPGTWQLRVSAQDGDRLGEGLATVEVE